MRARAARRRAAAPRPGIVVAPGGIGAAHARGEFGEACERGGAGRGGDLGHGAHVAGGCAARKPCRSGAMIACRIVRMIGRRGVLAGLGGGVALGAGLAGYGFGVEPFLRLVVQRHRVDAAGLAAGLHAARRGAGRPACGRADHDGGADRADRRRDQCADSRHHRCCWATTGRHRRFVTRLLDHADVARRLGCAARAAWASSP